MREAGNGVSVESRLRNSLKEAMILPDKTKQPSELQEMIQDAFDSRVTVIKADLSLEQLGVDEETYNMLMYEVDIIIHAAAQVIIILKIGNVLTNYHALNKIKCSQVEVAFIPT